MKHTKWMMAALCCLPALLRAEPLLKDGDRLAMLGDSITAQRRYAMTLDVYITLCSGLRNVKIHNFGLGGDLSQRAAARMEKFIFSYWHPTVMTVFFGMNHPEPVAFEKGQRAIAEKCLTHSCIPVFTSASCVDSGIYAKGDVNAVSRKNNLLEELSGITRQVARDGNLVYIDFFHPMLDVMAKVKKKNGPAFPFSGKWDGFHPDWNGHFVMAGEMLKGLGFDGEIGTITMDLKSGKASAAGNHQILSSGSGHVTVKSSQYPFCFVKLADSEASDFLSVLDMTDFQRKLNRYTLKVTGLDSEKAEVVWGDERKIFSKAELESGINLADAFRERNPFTEKFQTLWGEFSKKGYVETIFYCFIMPGLFRPATENFKEDSSLDSFCSNVLRDMQEEWNRRDAELRSHITPVEHSIKVVPVR